MEALGFNTDACVARSAILMALIGRSGYLEGIVRGFRAGLLTQNQYRCVRARLCDPI